MGLDNVSPYIYDQSGNEQCAELCAREVIKEIHGWDLLRSWITREQQAKGHRLGKIALQILPDLIALLDRERSDKVHPRSDCGLSGMPEYEGRNHV